MPLAIIAGPGSRLYVSPGGGGGSGPALGHSGINIATQNATDDVIIVDLRMNPSTYENIIWVDDDYQDGINDRIASMSYVSGGGYYGQGCARFIPGAAHGNEENDARHEMSCGIGAINGLNPVAPGGSCTKITVGFLVKFGPTYFSLGGQGKPLIIYRQDAVRRDNGLPRSSRPMVITDSSADFPPRRGMAPHDGTLGNFSTDPDATDYYNESGIAPNQLSLQNIPQWVQFEVDYDTPVDGGGIPVGQARLKIWTADGALAGTPVLRNSLTEDIGGTMPGIDIIMGWASTVQSIDANFYYDLEYIEIWVGQSTGMTPPLGFPGSAR